MSSTELFEAASISITSSEVALAIDTHESHTPHGADRRPVHAVQAGGEDLGHARLAGPARADEQVGVVDLPLLDGVRERAHDVLLPDDVGERARAVTAVERGAGGHGTVESSRAPARSGRVAAAAPTHAAESALGHAGKGGPCTLRRSRYPGRGRRLVTPVRRSRSAWR